MVRQTLRRFGLVAVIAATGLVGISATASAHVTVNPKEAPKAGYAKLAFRVPNERDDAGTTKLEIVFDANTPIPTARVRPMSGWEAEVTTRSLDKPIDVHGAQVTEAVDRIAWTAQGSTQIKPGEFQEFEISTGPLPHAEQVVFKAIQTYSNGEVVSWIEQPTADEEPEFPAPVLVLTEAAHDGAAAHGDAAGNSGDVQTAKNLSVAALSVAVLGLVVALAVLLRRRPGAAGSVSGSGNGAKAEHSSTETVADATTDSGTNGSESQKGENSPKN